MKIQSKIFKIAMIGYQLNEGGLEKVMSSLSVYFGKKGIEVHNILFVDNIAYPYSGKLVNIGKMKENNEGFIAKLKLFSFFKNYIYENDFDFIIDFRYRLHPLQELIISKLVYNSKTIYTVHSSNINNYLPKSRFLTKQICKSAYKVVCVSKGVANLVNQYHQIKNTAVIFNPIDVEEIKSKALESVDMIASYVISAGRFDSSNVKQFDELIISYSKSVLPHNGVNLVLLGDGVLKEHLMNTAINSGVKEQVLFLGFVDNPFKYFKNAMFFVLCSKYEGFPMTLIEALACEIPAISFDCLSGPNEIIKNKINGLLVENQNFEKLTIAIDLLYNNDILRASCKENSLESVQCFSLERIGKKWLDLMKINKNSRNER
ncbi:glycosyltransferase [Flavobacterium algicola]|uniref:glycosyltransferase n=1 Tax=Flavobacterium algicola TaxID=556529 RepID=UPI001EFC7306|nr:glycosyltransferase [Flavobacterium algicola]MCG9793649.1 glycosyltransferase [Flavobacterium algicola]